ncbi:tRNA1(Val) (adenine(37)-N6)-methyltransferase [Geobacter sp. AOG1]|uniref:tRNA1(Val) (adenine(37)-N6)-methyltransferase n=1 Tax=Geobacter sp. AOG1 TaxID=1566346 RepID=UPI001CC4D9D7|nr:methyltransferase domain-containing protein [Geobacter sp. AOG1]GFE57781.1 SAM-dependent methyltransferase [Geobacter sp. AOG1]
MNCCDETIDELRRFDLRLIQPRHGYRFSLDPLLLCEFADVREGERGVDLGTGCGVIPLVLARLATGVHFVGVEHQQAMVGIAERNAHLNGLGDQVTILEEDVGRLREHFPVSTFDLVTANPPYRRRGTGRISPRTGRDLARHESTAGLADFMATAKYLVKPTGRICFISHPSRLAEFFALATELKLAPLRLRMVHGYGDADARMFMVELAKGRKGELRVLPPLLVRNEGSDQEG